MIRPIALSLSSRSTAAHSRRFRFSTTRSASATTIATRDVGMDSLASPGGQRIEVDGGQTVGEPGLMIDRQIRESPGSRSG